MRALSGPGAAVALVSLCLSIVALPAMARVASQDEVAKLVATLQGSGAAYEKAEACRRLAVLGPREAVPALAALLGDRELGAHARTALEAIADPAAVQTLRAALARLKGPALIGAVNSLGARRDAAATPALVRLSRGPDVEIAVAALAALGRIATPAALVTLRTAVGSASAPMRAAAGDALLVCADRVSASGDRRAAAAAYDALRRADVPAHVRLAAARGAIVLRRSADKGWSDRAGAQLFTAMLLSPDHASARMALRVCRDLPGEDITRLLAREVAGAPAEMRPALARTIAARGDAAVLGAVEALAAAADAEVRMVAIEALGVIGKTSGVPVLLKALQAGSDAETEAASGALIRLDAPGAETALVAGLGTVPPSARARLVRVLGKRRAASAHDTILRLVEDADAVVRKEAFAALVGMARGADLGTLVRLAAGERDASASPAAEQAVRAAAALRADPNARSAPLGALLASSAGADAAPRRCAILRMLGQLGGHAALKSVRAALADPDASVQSAALESLAGWPDGSATPALLGVVKSRSDGSTRLRALRGAIGLIAALAADLPAPSRQLMGWVREANAAVGADAGERRLMLAALAEVRHAGALALAQTYLADPAVAAEAVAAVARIGSAASSPAPLRGMAKGLLLGVASQTTGEALRKQAADAAASIAGDAVPLNTYPSPASEVGDDVPEAAFTPIFDGASFGGWEGETRKTFRIEDGAVVGGSLKDALPHNEFLCTSRPYGDFVLRLECRLTNANAGIQIRSSRVWGSTEVAGYQADMDTGGTYWGCLYDESRRGMLVQADAPKVNGVVKKDDWNAYEIRCEGPRIRLFVNGPLTVDYTEKDEDVLQSGIIGLQVHGGAPSEARYRRVRVLELP